MRSTEYVLPVPFEGVIEERFIPGFPGYKINSLGHIFTCHKSDRNGERRWKPLSIWQLETDKYKSWRTMLVSPDHKPHNLRVAAIMAKAFLGPRPPGYRLQCKDRNRENHLASNLFYISPSEEIKQGYLFTPLKKGCMSISRKRSVEDIVTIRTEFARTPEKERREMIMTLAKRYNYRRCYIMDIVNGRLFTNDPGPVTIYSVFPRKPK